MSPIFSGTAAWIAIWIHAMRWATSDTACNVGCYTSATALTNHRARTTTGPKHAPTLHACCGTCTTHMYASMSADASDTLAAATQTMHAWRSRLLCSPTSSLKCATLANVKMVVVCGHDGIARAYAGRSLWCVHTSVSPCAPTAQTKGESRSGTGIATILNCLKVALLF